MYYKLIILFLHHSIIISVCTIFIKFIKKNKIYIRKYSMFFIYPKLSVSYLIHTDLITVGVFSN